MGAVIYDGFFITLALQKKLIINLNRNCLGIEFATPISAQMYFKDLPPPNSSFHHLVFVLQEVISTI